MKSGFRTLIASAVVCVMGGLPFAYAQNETTTGRSVINCDPAEPAPDNSCLYALPSNHFLADGDNVTILDADGNSIVSDWQVLAGDDRGVGATLVLIDRTPGADGGRRSAFDRVEQDMISQVVTALRPSETVAVYSFDSGIAKLSGFSTDRGRATAAIDALRLDGSNTNIPQNLRNAMNILETEDEVSVKTIILVSDGFDESGLDLQPIIDEAKDRNITISTMVTLWDTIGSEANGRGRGFMESLAQGTGGWTETFEMRRPTADAIAGLVSDLERDHTAIGYIALKEGATPRAATVKIRAETPVIGAPDEMRQVEFEAQFTPDDVPDEPVVPADPETDEDVPEVVVEPQAASFIDQLKTYWYIPLAIVLVLIGLLIALMRRSKPVEPETAETDEMDFSMPSLAPEPAPQPATRPVKVQVVGRLLDIASGQRFALQKGANGIGRGEGNIVRLTDKSISRSHAELQFLTRTSFRLSDLGSLNGTSYNGRKLVEPVVIEVGTEFMVGSVKLRLMAEN